MLAAWNVMACKLSRWQILRDERCRTGLLLCSTVGPRAASRARLATRPKAKADAVSDLKRVYACFGEGFKTADLRDVREIIQQFG